jgi:hypothetical protein
MNDHQLLAFIILLGGSVTINLLLYWLVICPTLFKRGLKFPTGMFWRFFHDLRVYQEICRAEARSLTIYYFCLILTWFNLVLGLVTVLRAIYEATKPPS